MSNEIVFTVGPKLPTAYEAALAIHSVSRCSKQPIRATAIHKYALAVRDLWVKAFTEDHVLGIKAVKNKLKKLLDDYDNKVYKPSWKNRREASGSTSTRTLNKKWGSEIQVGSTSGLLNTSLLDIGKNTHLLTGREEEFYKHQLLDRVGQVTNEIDTEFEEERTARLIEEEENAALEAKEELFSNPSEYQEVVRRSSRESVPRRFEDKGTQTPTEFMNVRPEIRGGRNSLPHLKDK